jgi:hypothetical protein
MVVWASLKKLVLLNIYVMQDFCRFMRELQRFRANDLVRPENPQEDGGAVAKSIAEQIKNTGIQLSGKWLT